MYPLITYPDWIRIVRENAGLSAQDFVLKYAGNVTWPVREIAEQISCYPKAIKKACSFHIDGMLYTRQSLEQSSGYAASAFRARRWGTDRIHGFETDEPLRVWDMTGGLGMDTLAWAKAGAYVIYSEIHSTLLGMARHNHALHGVGERITYLEGDAMNLLKQKSPASEKVDLLYLDPSRREEGKRVYSIKDSQPNVLDFIPDIRLRCHKYLIKLSPMMDIIQASQELEDVTHFYVVSVNGEVKEVLAFCDLTIQKKGQNPLVTAVILDNDGHVTYEISNETSLSPVAAGHKPATCLYDADPAIYKADLMDVVGSVYGLRRIHPSAGYLAGSEMMSDFPGTVYKIREAVPYKPKKLKKWLHQKGLTRVHIHQRGFSQSVDTLFKVLGCTMGDGAHLIATRDESGDRCIFVTDPIKKSLSSDL